MEKNIMQKKKLKIFTELFLSCFANIVMEVSNIEWFQNNFILRLLTLIVFFIIVIEIYFYIIEKIKHYISSSDYDSTATIIKKIGKRYSLDEQNELFYFPQKNEQIFLGRSIYGKTPNKKKKNIVYYALSAKQHLNWIDYLYFKYIRRLKDELKADIIIALHVPDNIRLCKVNNLNNDPNALNKDYQNIINKFSEYIYKIIGNDVRIIKEETFYNHNIKRFKNFHLVYDAFILHFASLINTSGDKGIDFEMFKRNLSHVRSAFPIWMISTKYKSDRIFILDNALSMEIWKYDPLCKIRENCELYFIEVNDIKYANGIRINVHNKNNTINFTDDMDTIKKKINNMDIETKKTIIQLIWYSENDPGVSIASAVDETFINNYLLNVINKIEKNYRFNS